MTDYILETCVDSTESALIAANAGANRLELCSNLIIGGTTPSPYLFKEIRKYTDIKIHVLIRPRFGDFCYSEHEFNIMKEEIFMFQKLGADGIVIGALNPDGSLDTVQMEQLIAAAGDMTVVLHRAFDVCRDPFSTLHKAVELGINTILTSGQSQTALEGLELIKKLNMICNNKIDLLIGGGINASSIQAIHAATGINSFHLSGKETYDSPMKFRRTEVHMGLPGISEYQIQRTAREKIACAKKMCRILPSLEKYD